MSIIKNKAVSQWTEGMASMQLSQFGLIKFDILGLLTMVYNVYTEKLIKQTTGIIINWSDCHPNCEEPYAGHEIHEDGRIIKISFNDEKALKMMNDRKTDAVFQFDTPIAKRVLENKVYSFHDIVAITALARPGPMDTIPEWIKRRDDPKQLWKKKEDPRIVEILKDTYGIIIYQEQLTKILIKIGGLTVPEAEKARKMVAKKKKEEVIKLGPKVVQGFIKNGFENHQVPINDNGIYEGAKPHSAQGWWSRIVPFAGYAFNASHAYSYGVIAYRSLWLKAHYPSQFWASILTYCKIEKIPKFIGIAKLEGVKFQPITVGHLNDKFNIDENTNVHPSLKMIKGIGQSVAKQYSKNSGKCTDINDFILKYGKKKGPMERLIKLGAFDNVHKNKRKQLWLWYLYKYASKNEQSDKIREIYKNWYYEKYWPGDKIEQERKRQETEFKKAFPKKQIPKKIQQWKPNIGPKSENPTIDNFIIFCDELFVITKYNEQDEFYYNDWTLKEYLEFEKQYYGSYWTSPLTPFKHNPLFTFNNIKNDEYKCNYLDGVIEDMVKGKTKKNTDYLNLFVNDGTETQSIKIWGDCNKFDKEILKPGHGIRLSAEWNEKYQSFNIAKSSTIRSLTRL
jgi:DNA polymerase III alpha subunit